MNAMTSNPPHVVVMMATTKFGEWLRRERLAKRMSGRKLAELAETTHASVSRFETGERSPSRKMVTRIANALGSDPHEALEALIADTPGLEIPALEERFGALSFNEKRLLQLGAKMSEREREMLLALLQAMVEDHGVVVPDPPNDLEGGGK